LTLIYTRKHSFTLVKRINVETMSPTICIPPMKYHQAIPCIPSVLLRPT